MKTIPNKDTTIKWGEGELKAVLARAEKLSVAELKELTESVGIHFITNRFLEADQYIGALDEADDKEKVLKYLESKNI
ncbi:MAG: hypothetical protein ABIP54_04630 [Candidatus Andersenbacteria bacterium]